MSKLDSSGDLPVVVDNSHNGAGGAAQHDLNAKLFASGYGDSGSTSHGITINRGDSSAASSAAKVGDHIVSGSDDYFRMPDRGGGIGSIIEFEPPTKTPTKEEVSDAEKQFDSKISSMIRPEDAELLKKIGHGMLEGDPKAVAAALGSIHDPEKLKQVVKEMNRMMKDLGTDMQLAVGPDGHVLMYDKNGSVAIDIDPSKGQVVGERPIEVQGGKVILKDGTILNPDPDADAKQMGNGAVGNIEDPWHGIFKNPLPSPFPEWPSPREPKWPEPKDPWWKYLQDNSKSHIELL